MNQRQTDRRGAGGPRPARIDIRRGIGAGVAAAGQRAILVRLVLRDSRRPRRYVLPLSRKRDPLVGRALRNHDRETRFRALALAVDEGLWTHARSLAKYVSEGDADPALVQAIRLELQSAEPPIGEDPWAEILRQWAMDESLGHPAVARQPTRSLRVASSSPLRVRLGVLGDLSLVIVATLTMSRLAGLLQGFPPGYDAYGHMAKVKLILATWPHIAWNDAWYSGLPYFQGSYPPLYHLLVAAVTVTTGCSISTAMVAVAVAAVTLVVVGVWASVRILTSSRPAALGSAAVVLTATSFWAAVVDAGLYPRLVATGFLTWAVVGVCVCLRRPSRIAFAGTVVTTLLALSTHLFVGLLAFAAVSSLLLAGLWVQGRSLWRVLGLMTATGGLAGYFYVPFVLGSRAASTFTAGFSPVPFRALVWPGPRLTMTSVPPVLLTGTAILAITVHAAARRPRSRMRRGLRRSLARLRPPGLESESRLTVQNALRTNALRDSASTRSRLAVPAALALVSGAAALVFSVYAVIGHVVAFTHYLVGLGPADVLVFVVLFGALAAGWLAGGLASGRWRVAGSVFLAIGLTSGLVAMPVLRKPPLVYNGATKAGIEALLPSSAISRDYRIGGTEDITTDWINAKFSTPQIRGYQAEGRPNPVYQAMLETSLKAPKVSAAERDFMLDWWGVRWFYAGPLAATVASYDSRPDLYTLDARFGGFATYTYRQATPILAATKAPIALVIGDAINYEYVLRSLAAAGTTSSQLIPVQGGRYVDDYSLGELQRFDVVVLYGAREHNRSAVGALLDRYVRAGGGLVADSGDDTDAQMAQPLAPLPVTSMRAQPVSGTFQLLSSNDPAVTGVDLRDVGPARYGPGPWEVRVPSGRTPDASPVVHQESEYDLVIARPLGQGRVVWSGMNLPYHVSVYNRAGEARLFSNMITSSALTRNAGAVSAESTYVNNEHRRAVVRRGTGVLFKESFNAGWHAAVDGRPVAIQRAGPGFMFVPLPALLTGSVQVDFSFRAPLIERAGLALSVLSALVLACYLLGLLSRRRVWSVVERVTRVFAQTSS